jgi:hypothetical protein
VQKSLCYNPLMTDIDKKASDVREKLLDTASKLLDRVNGDTTASDAAIVIHAAVAAFTAATARSVDVPPDPGATRTIDPPPDPGVAGVAGLHSGDMVTIGGRTAVLL